MKPVANYWPVLINILLQKYFSHLTTSCILWHNDFDVILEAAVMDTVLLQINTKNLKSSFSKDIYNFTRQDEYFNDKQVFYNDLVKKYIAAIQNANCEGFFVFQDDIPLFAKTFRRAAVYSIWRSTNNRFLFAYVKDKQKEEVFFEDVFFKNQPNILVIEADAFNSSNFYLKTNKFVGSRKNHPEELILLSTFNALNVSFSPDIDLFSNKKLQDLQEREIIVACLDYRPYVAVDYERLPQYYDHAEDNPTHLVHVNGVETRVCHTFCEIYNCTVQFDTSEKEEWGVTYSNFTGTGLMGMLIEGKVDMMTGGVYAWLNDYMNTDVTAFLGRSGVTCLVPAPIRTVSWDLPLRPFKITLWFAILAVLILEMVCLLFARKFEKTLENSQHKNEWWSSFMFGFVSAFKLFLNQSTDYSVQANTIRVMLFACFMHDIIMTCLYGSGLASILTMPILTDAADSVERMYTHDLKWAATSYAWMEPIKDVKDDPIIMRFFNNFKAFKLEEIREMAKTENMGFAVERLSYGHLGNLDFVTPESMRHLKIMIDDIYYGYTVGKVTRLWPHLPKYNDLIWAWHSSGFDKIWEWKIAAEYLNVSNQNQVIASKYFNFDTGPVELSMNNFGGMILMWLLGMILSIFVFVAEVLTHKIIQEKKDSKRTK